MDPTFLIIFMKFLDVIDQSLNLTLELEFGF